MPKFIMMVGLPASGKSTFAKELSITEDALLLSSDQMRIEMFGDENHREEHGKLFEEIYKRAKTELSNGRSVIIDATNISSKKRMGALHQFSKYEKECYYFATPFEVCVQRNRNRERVVPQEALDRMYKTCHVPAYYEGWNRIHFVHYIKRSKVKFDPFSESLAKSHDALFSNLIQFHRYFDDILNLAQDTQYHTFSVSRHTYYVMNHLMKNYEGIDKDQMLWSAILHDLGKSVCKQFKENARYANFLGHENVSAQMSVEILRKAGYDDEFIHDVTSLVQLHMRLLQNKDSESANEKLRKMIGDQLFEKLVIFREADVSAK